MLTDLVRAILISLYFVVNLVKQVCKQGVVVKVTVDLCCCGVVLGLESDSVNAKNIVFQGSFRYGLLRMLDIGGNDNKVAGSYRTSSFAEEKVSLPFQYKKDLCKMMGMEYALPVLIIFG